MRLKLEQSKDFLKDDIHVETMLLDDSADIVIFVLIMQSEHELSSNELCGGEAI